MTLILLLLFCSVSSPVRHSLINYFTGSAGAPNVTQFVGVAVVDGVEAVYCDSSNKILEPRQDWVKKVFDNDSQLLEWYKHECFNIQPSAFRARIISLKQQFNQSEGFHILQTRTGCEWEENTGEKSGFLKYGYDGEDFLELDLNTLSWASLKPEAEATKQSWDADRNRTKLNEVFLTDICPERLKSFLDCGNSSLQRTVPPSVSLLQKTPSSPVSCHATGFYPDRAVMFWRKDGEKVHEGVEIGDILPNDDGTFQMSVNLNVSSFTPEECSRFDCVFQFSDVEKIIVTKLNKTLIRTNWKEKMTKEKSSNRAITVIVVLLVFILVAVAGFAFYKKKKEKHFTPSAVNICELSEGKNEVTT
ncbi:major histocompatibility complex class I-related gene protein [Oreochromis niloticus]|uniref:Major histocompatibility complex class I-related gene protein n=1 Tax=Oreochromis niloticus TaxID=8128 RepID=A0A669CDV0_ORENI|nr:major histocompatibility complex class I-related gene protein [Oreochromis niloticus]